MPSRAASSSTRYPEQAMTDPQITETTDDARQGETSDHMR
jgi:hypothetical protein